MLLVFVGVFFVFLFFSTSSSPTSGCFVRHCFVGLNWFSDPDASGLYSLGVVRGSDHFDLRAPRVCQVTVLFSFCLALSFAAKHTVVIPIPFLFHLIYFQSVKMAKLSFFGLLSKAAVLQRSFALDMTKLDLN